MNNPEICGTWWVHTGDNEPAMCKQDEPPNGIRYEACIRSSGGWKFLKDGDRDPYIRQMPFDGTYFEPERLYKVVITPTSWTYEEYATIEKEDK